MKRIYLAGPDVFRPDAIEHGKYLAELCKKYDYQGVYPLDNEAPSHLKGLQLAEWIYQGNLALIMGCDIVMANLNFFRGAEPDSGTCWEVGYAKALGKPVYAYLDGHGSLPDRLLDQTALKMYQDGNDEYREYYNSTLIEDFGHPINLMIACSAKIIVGNAEDCLKAIRGDKNHMSLYIRNEMSDYEHQEDEEG